MAVKTVVRGLTHRQVGLNHIERTIIDDGVEYPIHLALFDASGNNVIEVNTKDSDCFIGLQPDTDYVIWTVITDEVGNIKSRIDDTDVRFKTLQGELYKPVIIERNGMVRIQFRSPIALQNCYWMPDDDQSPYYGFGVGFELRDASGSVLGTKYWDSNTTQIEFTALTEDAFVMPILWSGSRDGSVRDKWFEISEADITPIGKFNAFSFPTSDSAEIHVRLENFWCAEMFSVYNGEEEIITVNNPRNKVYVVPLNDLSSDTDYSLDLTIRCGSISFLSVLNFSTQEDKDLPIYDRPNINFKDFWIAVGQPGAYNENMNYDIPFGVKDVFGIKIKHAPFSVMPKIKNVVVQSWKDENGDDVWLPRRTGSTPGIYEPAVTHEAVDYNPTFVFYIKGVNGDFKKDANQMINAFVKRIEGRWLKVFDYYTYIGYEGVYLVDVDDDPKFKRRDNYVHVEFQLKFKINGVVLDAPFEGIGSGISRDQE